MLPLGLDFVFCHVLCIVYKENVVRSKKFCHNLVFVAIICVLYVGHPVVNLVGILKLLLTESLKILNMPSYLSIGCGRTVIDSFKSPTCHPVVRNMHENLETALISQVSRNQQYLYEYNIGDGSMM